MSYRRVWGIIWCELTINSLFMRETWRSKLDVRILPTFSFRRSVVLALFKSDEIFTKSKLKFTVSPGSNLSFNGTSTINTHCLFYSNVYMYCIIKSKWIVANRKLQTQWILWNDSQTIICFGGKSTEVLHYKDVFNYLYYAILC